MKRYLVFPLNDPEGIIYKHLHKVTPFLKKHFERGFIGITPITVERQNTNVSELEKDRFFIINYNSPNSNIGEHHISVYKNATNHLKQEDFVHLCTPDRLAFAIEKYRNSFLKDIQTAEKYKVTIFQRSEKAWSTHPTNFHAIENAVNEAGNILFGKYIDYSWCHLIVKNKLFKNVVPKLKGKNIVIFAEIAYYLRAQIITKDVDWLSWEDPFILGKDAKSLKIKREKDSKENEKRLAYAMPMINFLLTKWQSNLK